MNEYTLIGLELQMSEANLGLVENFIRCVNTGKLWDGRFNLSISPPSPSTP